MPEARIAGLPAHLHRGKELIGADGSMHDVRLKRENKGEKEVRIWRWEEAPFTGTRGDDNIPPTE